MLERFDESFQVFDGDRQRGVTLASQRRGHFVSKMDAHSSIEIRAEGQPIIDERTPYPDRSPPSVVPRDVRLFDVVEPSSKCQQAERRVDVPGVGHGHSVLGAAKPNWEQNGQKPAVDCVREMTIHLRHARTTCAGGRPQTIGTRT